MADSHATQSDRFPNGYVEKTEGRIAPKDLVWSPSDAEFREVERDDPAVGGKLETFERVATPAHWVTFDGTTGIVWGRRHVPRREPADGQVRGVWGRPRGRRVRVCLLVRGDEHPRVLRDAVREGERRRPAFHLGRPPGEAHHPDVVPPPGARPASCAGEGLGRAKTARMHGSLGQEPKRTREQRPHRSPPLGHSSHHAAGSSQARHHRGAKGVRGDARHDIAPRRAVLVS
jgi:hypothetical protein